MRTDELLSAIRAAAMFGDADDDFTDARLLHTASNTLRAVFERAVVTSRGGYWLKRVLQSTTAGTEKYRLPHRACMQGLERIQIADSGNVFGDLHELSPKQAQDFEGVSGSRGRPQVFFVEGEAIRLYPVPDGVYTLRFYYYLRPSRLATQQASTLGSGTVRGQITAVNTSARTLVVNVIPHDMLDVSPAATITTGSQLIDVVKPTGWHEAVLVGAAQTYSGTTITVGGSDDMSEIAVGDFVRSADQTDWPAIPDEFHETLALLVASRVCKARDFHEKAAQLLEDANSDAQRFQALLVPRVKDQPRVLIPRGGPIRRRAVLRGWVA